MSWLILTSSEGGDVAVNLEIYKPTTITWLNDETSTISFHSELYEEPLELEVKESTKEIIRAIEAAGSSKTQPAAPPNLSGGSISADISAAGVPIGRGMKHG